jgi:hypothetical protein
MLDDITEQVIETVAENAVGGWCSRPQVESLMGATTVDKREVDRALKRAVAEGRLERDGDRYRVVDEE